MKSIERRIARPEQERGQINLKTMPDEELLAYRDTLESQSPAWWAATMVHVFRHARSFEVVHDDPAFRNGKYDWNWDRD